MSAPQCPECGRFLSHRDYSGPPALLVPMYEWYCSKGDCEPYNVVDLTTGANA